MAEKNEPSNNNDCRGTLDLNQIGKEVQTPDNCCKKCVRPCCPFVQAAQKNLGDPVQKNHCETQTAGSNFKNAKGHCPCPWGPGSPPSESPNYDNLWDLQFCRWWGWNWVRKHEHSCQHKPSQAPKRDEQPTAPGDFSTAYKQKPSKKQETLKKKHKGNFWTKLFRNDENDKKADNKGVEKQNRNIQTLQRLYDTPCSSINNDQDQGHCCYCPMNNLDTRTLHFRGDYEWRSSSERQSSSSVVQFKTRHEVCKCNMRKVQSWMREKCDNSSSDECCPCLSKHALRQPPSQDSVEYLAMRLRCINSDQAKTEPCCPCQKPQHRRKRMQCPCRQVSIQQNDNNERKKCSHRQMQRCRCCLCQETKERRDLPQNKRSNKLQCCHTHEQKNGKEKCNKKLKREYQECRCCCAYDQTKEAKSDLKTKYLKITVTKSKSVQITPRMANEGTCCSLAIPKEENAKKSIANDSSPNARLDQSCSIPFCPNCSTPCCPTAQPAENTLRNPTQNNFAPQTSSVNPMLLTEKRIKDNFSKLFKRDSFESPLSGYNYNFFPANVPYSKTVSLESKLPKPIHIEDKNFGLKFVEDDSTGNENEHKKLLSAVCEAILSARKPHINYRDKNVGVSNIADLDSLVSEKPSDCSIWTNLKKESKNDEDTIQAYIDKTLTNLQLKKTENLAPVTAQLDLKNFSLQTEKRLTVIPNRHQQDLQTAVEKLISKSNTEQTAKNCSNTDPQPNTRGQIQINTENKDSTKQLPDESMSTSNFNNLKTKDCKFFTFSDYGARIKMPYCKKRQSNFDFIDPKETPKILKSKSQTNLFTSTCSIRNKQRLIKSSAIPAKKPFCSVRNLNDSSRGNERTGENCRKIKSLPNKLACDIILSKTFDKLKQKSPLNNPFQYLFKAVPPPPITIQQAPDFPQLFLQNIPSINDSQETQTGAQFLSPKSRINCNANNFEPVYSNDFYKMNQTTSTLSTVPSVTTEHGPEEEYKSVNLENLLYPDTNQNMPRSAMDNINLIFKLDENAPGLGFSSASFISGMYSKGPYSKMNLERSSNSAYTPQRSDPYINPQIQKNNSWDFSLKSPFQEQTLPSTSHHPPQYCYDSDEHFILNNLRSYSDISDVGSLHPILNETKNESVLCTLLPNVEEHSEPSTEPQITSQFNNSQTEHYDFARSRNKGKQKREYIRTPRSPKRESLFSMFCAPVDTKRISHSLARRKSIYRKERRLATVQKLKVRGFFGKENI